MERMATFGLLLLTLTAGCGRQSTTPSSDTEEFVLPADQVAYRVRHYLTQDGIRRALLTSDTAYAYEQSRRLDLIGVTVEFFDDAGVALGTLTSKTGDYEMSNRTFIARDELQLVMNTEDQTRILETDELHYDVGADRIWSERPFVLLEGERVTRGTSFRSDSRFRTWEVRGGQTQGPVEGEGGLSF
jgi:LPS export ABC transporter protein LptC